MLMCLLMNIVSQSIYCTLHHADGEPTMSQLQLLHNSERKIEIIKTIAPRWHFFGSQLNFDSDNRTINVIKEKNKNDPESACQEMFQWWLRGQGDQPVSWRTLAQLLEDSGYKKLAADIRTHFKF